MRRGFALLAIFLMMATGAALATVSKVPVAQQFTPGSSGDLAVPPMPAPEFGRPAEDTIWFGGCDPATGFAREGYFWDWDTDIVTCPFQGWTSVDETTDEAVYFGRVTSTDFTNRTPPDPCVPMLVTGSTNNYQLWVGVHEDEARSRDWEAGMGYANNQCQYALSPEYPVGHAGTIDFLFFNDTEPGFDYTFVQCLCYNASHQPLPGEDHVVEVTRFDGIEGTYQVPAAFDGDASLSAGTAYYRVRLQFESDGGWSDEDGDWDTQCGPFACDAVQIGTNFYNFESGAQGWTFGACPGIGAFMGVAGYDDWVEWLEFAGVLCECALSGNAIEFIDEENSPYWPPGHPSGHAEMAVSNIVVRVGTPYQPPDYNAAITRWNQYVYLRHADGGHYRAGWMIYPYSSEVNPTPHWSGRRGQGVWYYTGDDPDCYLTGANYTSPPDGDVLPAAWDSMRVTHQILVSCDMFGIPSTACQYEGNTWGSPVIDNFRLGIAGVADAPGLTLETGHNFMDAFGMNFPRYVEPCDVGWSSISYDVSRDDPDRNDWTGDTALVSGPTVSAQDPSTRWACELCMKIVREGPCQDRTPGYQEWKARFTTDPEVDWACARMDSNQTRQGVFANKYETYFHESDPGYDPAYGDRTPEQEIAPDGLFTPGTQLQYKYRGWWWNGGAPPDVYSEMGPWEFEILPGMTPTDQQGWDWEYPSVLYVDAFNRGSEYYITPVLDQVLGVGPNGEKHWDKFDALDASSNYDAPLRRSFGGTYYGYNGWGNNGCSDHQLLSYRLILVNSGTFGGGGGGLWDHNNTYPAPNWVMLENWVEETDCELGAVRRGLILDGDGIAAQINNDTQGHPDFLNNVLGATLEDVSYREANNDWEYCVDLATVPGGPVIPASQISLYGNGCPNQYNYGVVGEQPGLESAVGNLDYYSYLGSGTAPRVHFAQVLRYDNNDNEDFEWMTAVNGFSFHHISRVGCETEHCSTDSTCVVQGAADLFGPMINWMVTRDQPFDPWRYPCSDVGVDTDGEGHLAGPVNYLFNSRPNPFSGSAVIRFSLAREGDANLAIYDVAGRLVKTLLDGKVAAGETTVAWDGTDNGGRRAGTGIFWMQLVTHDGYESGKRMVFLN